MASFHFSIKSGKKGQASTHEAYITRRGKHHKGDENDLVCTGHGNMPQWTNGNPSAYWKASDKHERVNGATYREYEIALPRELNQAQQKALVEEIIQSTIGDKPYQFAIHAPNASLDNAETNTHAHIMFSDRKPDGVERTAEQTFRRYNAKNPAAGGCKKDSGGRASSVLRKEVIATREKCAELQNQALEKIGSAERVDHRSLKDQGIERKPEHHLGQARIRKMSKEDKAEYAVSREKSYAN